MELIRRRLDLVGPVLRIERSAVQNREVTDELLKDATHATGGFTWVSASSTANITSPTLGDSD